MAAVSKGEKLAKSLKDRLNALGCPYTEDVDESWIIELVFKPGEPRIRLLQWILAKFDRNLGELVDNSQAAIVGSRLDSRIQRLLYVFSNLGLCRYDDVDLIRGLESTSPNSVGKQTTFIDQLVDIVMIHDAAEDPMTKSLLSPGIVSDSSPLEDQLVADCRYLDAVASLHLPGKMLTPNIDLIPHDIQRHLKSTSTDSVTEVPSLQKLTEMCSNVERILSHRVDVLNGLQEEVRSASPQQLQRANQALDLVLGELSQLVLSFTYCFENEMLPWCDRSPPPLSPLGPAFKRVHALTQHFAQMLEGMRQIHQSYNHLDKGTAHKLKTTESKHATLLAEVSQAAANSLQECVDVLETSIQREHPALSTSLCSSLLKL